MKVEIVIVNYKTANLTINCLKSLVEEYNKIEFHVIVIDNRSNDGSYETISKVIAAKEWSEWVSVYQADINGGFSYGNNLGIRKCMDSGSLPDYFLLLNPDTYIRIGAIQSLLNFMESHPNVGIAGSRLEDPDGTPQMSAFRFHSFLSELERGACLGMLTKCLRPWIGNNRIPEGQMKTDWVAGASMMIRSSVFYDIGLLDESYFMYYEEMDFCLQAARKGWFCWYVPESRVVHYVGQSSGVTDNKISAKRRPQYWFDSRRRYFLKNFGAISALLTDMVFLLGFASWRLRNLVQKKPHNFPPYFLWDSLCNSVFVKGFRIMPVQNQIEETDGWAN